jgi:hypothetical protein
MASPIRRERVAERDGFLTPVLAVSIAIVIFAVVTQCLAATGAISLSPTQQLTLWLVAAGLIVLLWIAYMSVETQSRLAKELAAARAAADREVATARETARARIARAERIADERVAAARRGPDDTAVAAESGTAEAESWDPWVPPQELRRLDGSVQEVNTADVFPNGCYLDSISEPQDYGEETDTRGAVVDINRIRMYQCTVVDLNPTLKDRPHDPVVNILADQKPSQPPGVRYPVVEFDGLTITRYVTDGSPIRMGYELRATGIRLGAGEAAAEAS